jgi:23S rRNA (cytosine1962-C5)-methyltransferase
VHLKRRRTGGAERGYGRMDQRQQTFVVPEGKLRFRVNLDDFLDTGLFADHRITREKVRDESAGKKVLNLFSYTGSFSMAAAAGGATSVTSVDASERYLAWAEENRRLNQQDVTTHRMIATDARGFLSRHSLERWDLIICDPPSFSVRPDAPEWDIQHDHPELLRAMLEVLNPGGILWFSTNHQRFEPNFLGLGVQIVDKTEETVPTDYRNRQVHQCWRMVKD